jgi:hypothetical protein
MISSGASLSTLLALGVLFSAACGTSRGSLRRGTEDPRAGDSVSAGQPPPPPPAVTSESDPDNLERRFPYKESRARREALKNQPEEPDRGKIVIDTGKPAPSHPPTSQRPSSSPSGRAAVAPAAYRAGSAADAAAPERNPPAPQR